MTQAPELPPAAHAARRVRSDAGASGDPRDRPACEPSPAHSARRSTSSPATRTSRRCCPTTSGSPTVARRDSSCREPRRFPTRRPASSRAGNLLGLDPPEHQRLRRMLTPEFTIRRMKRLEPRIVEIVDAQLDAMENTGPPADLVSSFALPIPSLVICELLGVPYEDREDFQRRRTRQLDLSLPISERLELVRRGREYMALVGASGPGGTPARTSSACLSAITATSSPTTNSSASQACCCSPGTRPRRTCSVSARWHCCAIPISWPRSATIPTRSGPPSRSCCAGCRSCKARFRASPPPTSRSPAYRFRPDSWSSFRCRRAIAIRTSSTRRRCSTSAAARQGHLAFGHGVHHCLGAPLARMEMRIAFPALLRRFPTLALAEDFDEVQFRSFHFIYGLKSLAVKW